MKKLKEIVICLIAVVALVTVINNCILTKSYAASSDLETMIDDFNTNTENIASDLNAVDDEPVNANKNVNKSTGNNVNKANNSNTNSGIPYAGSNNTIVLVIIACGISTVFAYRKIKEYKNI